MKESDLDLPVSDDWEEIPDYVCRECKCKARQHPSLAHIWGCLKCGYTTASVFLMFSPTEGNPLSAIFGFPQNRRRLVTTLEEATAEQLINELFNRFENAVFLGFEPHGNTTDNIVSCRKGKDVHISGIVSAYSRYLHGVIDESWEEGRPDEGN